MAAIVFFCMAVAISSTFIYVTGPSPVYALQKVKSIIDLQPFSSSSSVNIKSEEGEGAATLTNLNPAVNAWYLLKVDWHKGRGTEEYYHLENVNPGLQSPLLSNDYPYGFILSDGKTSVPCELWRSNSRGGIRAAKVSGITYAPLCGAKLYLRNPAKGYRTEIETASEFLRNELPGGEKIETFIRDTFFIKGYKEKAEIKEKTNPPREVRPAFPPQIEPAPASVDPVQGRRVLVSSHLGIEIQQPGVPGMSLGSWYPVKDNAGMYISLITANAISSDIMQSYRNLVRRLDASETDALVYLIAFDLDQFELKYCLGTDHPKVGWSDHMLDKMKDKSLPG
ncbi:MAG: hypothetical protein PHN75_07760, partial [Syntrophales bacterium]|nr:hypothetical protein [Syntrophales bacterium]